MNAYCTYIAAHQVGNFREIDRVFKSQALADAAGATDRPALTGAISVNAEPGWWVDIATQTMIQGAVHRNVQAAPPADPHADLRGALAKLHLADLTLSQVIDEVSRGFPDAVRSNAQDLMLRVRQFTYRLAVSAAYTKAQKMAWAARMAGGPTDAPVTDTEPATLAEAVRRVMKQFDDGTLSVPALASAWVNPADATATALGSMVTLAGPAIPADVNLATGDWIATFTVPADPAPDGDE